MGSRHRRGELPRHARLRGRRAHLPLPSHARIDVRTHGLWAHLELAAAGAVVLRASFERGRLAYCTSAVPGLAGLRGGTYDPPTAILELYQRVAA